MTPYVHNTDCTMALLCLVRVWKQACTPLLADFVVYR